MIKVKSEIDLPVQSIPPFTLTVGLPTSNPQMNALLQITGMPGEGGPHISDGGYFIQILDPALTLIWQGELRATG